MTKRNLKISLIFMDVVVLVIIFISVFFLYQLVIKKILIHYSIDKFYESMRTTQFDISNSISYIEEKEELPYKDFISDIFEYVKVSTLKRSRYDHSLVAILFPENHNYLEAGIRNDTNRIFDKRYFKYEDFYKQIKEAELKNEKNKKNGKIKPTEAFKDIKKELLQLREKNYLEFKIRGKKYIGIAVLSKTGIRKKFNRDSTEFIYPIIIIADSNDEFFFLLNRVGLVFIFLFVLIFGLGAFFKFYNTNVVTKEIYSVRDRMRTINNEIKTKGIVTHSAKEINTKFIETADLNKSFHGLVGSLEDLGSIISGIADEDLFKATLINDDSLLKPHDEMMTTMFLDIQGFTSITEKHKDNIIGIINHIWTEVEQTISKYNGKINKLIGDAALIIFRENECKANITSSMNAFFSSIKLLEKVPKINKDLDIDFNFRVGLDYGKVTYGKTGTENNYELGVIGDSVNTASRLEALSKQYHTNLLMTENVFNNMQYNLSDIYDIKEQLKLDSSFDIKLFRIDKARPKGKKEAKEIITLLIKKNNKFRFIGSNDYYNSSSFDTYIKLVDMLLLNIKYWKKYQDSKTGKEHEITEEALTLKENANKVWSDIATKFALFLTQTNFPPAEHFIKMLLKYEEYAEFLKYKDMWFQKPIHRVKEPSDDWIKLGTVELSK